MAIEKEQKAIRMKREIIDYVQSEADHQLRTFPQQVEYFLRLGIEAHERKNTTRGDIAAGRTQINPEYASGDSEVS